VHELEGGGAAQRRAGSSEKNSAIDAARRIGFQMLPAKRAGSCCGTGQAPSLAKLFSVYEQYRRRQFPGPVGCGILLAFRA
jgi:hypothetical protein